MSDSDGAAPEQGENAGESGTPLTPEDRIHALEQLVVPMFKDWASRDTGEDDGPAVGTAGAVAETAEEDAGGPWSWDRVNDDRRQALSGELTAFVTYLTDRYLRHLSAETYPFAARWFENPVAVEILTGVMVAHQAVYTDYKPEPSRDLADWHEHILWPALDRIKALRLFPDGEIKASDRTVEVDDDARSSLAGEVFAVGVAEHPATSGAVNVRDASTGLITLP
jgi:hypothetical protein